MTNWWFDFGWVAEFKSRRVLGARAYIKKLGTISLFLIAVLTKPELFIVFRL